MRGDKLLKKLRLTSDRALYRIGYIHALTDLVKLIERMESGRILCNIDNLIEFVEHQKRLSRAIAEREVTE